MKKTIADRIAERMRGWITERGTHLLDLCERLAEDVQYTHRGPSAAAVTARYRMADGSSIVIYGSSIVICGDWWDVE